MSVTQSSNGSNIEVSCLLSAFFYKTCV